MDHLGSHRRYHLDRRFCDQIIWKEPASHKTSVIFWPNALKKYSLRCIGPVVLNLLELTQYSTCKLNTGLNSCIIVHDKDIFLIEYTRHLSSCFFVGCTHSPRSHSYLCSRGFVPLPPRCILKSIGYISGKQSQTKPSFYKIFVNLILCFLINNLQAEHFHTGYQFF